MRLDGIQDDNSNQDHEIANDLSMVATDAVKHVQSASAEKRAKLAAVEGGRLQYASLVRLHGMLSKIAEATYMIDDQLSCIAAKSIVIPPALVTSLWAAKIEMHAEASAITLYMENNREDDTPKICYAAMAKLQSAREKVTYMSNKLTAIIPPSCVHAWGDVQEM